MKKAKLQLSLKFLLSKSMSQKFWWNGRGYRVRNQGVGWEAWKYRHVTLYRRRLRWLCPLQIFEENKTTYNENQTSRTDSTSFFFLFLITADLLKKRGRGTLGQRTEPNAKGIKQFNCWLCWTLKTSVFLSQSLVDHYTLVD